MLEHIEKPWGYYIDIKRSPHKVYKLLHVNPHSSISLQSHSKRSEIWYIVDGSATVRIGNHSYHALTGEVYHIPNREKHRLINDTDNPVELFEEQFGELCMEGDIVRYEDDYNRV